MKSACGRPDDKEDVALNAAIFGSPSTCNDVP